MQKGFTEEGKHYVAQWVKLAGGDDGGGFLTCWARTRAAAKAWL